LRSFFQNQEKLEINDENENGDQDDDDDEDINMNKSLSIVRKQKLQEFPVLYLEEETLANEKFSASDSSSANTSRSLNNSLKQFFIHDEEELEENLNKNINDLATTTTTTTTAKNKVASRSTNELQENGGINSHYYSYKYPLMSVSSHSFNKNLSLGKKNIK